MQDVLLCLSNEEKMETYQVSVVFTSIIPFVMFVCIPIILILHPDSIQPAVL